MAGGQLSARLLNASYGPDPQEINRACPIVSGLTFWFDRGEDFFRWPGLVYGRFFYVGIFAGGDLSGYCMAGLTRAWTGQDLGWLAVLGDARILPEHRGLGWIDVALEKLAQVVPRSVALGLFIINEGNRAAEHLRNRFRLEGYDVRPAGRLTVQNLLLIRPRRRVPGVAITTATPADLGSLPEPGEAFRSLTITNLAVRGGDPRVLRALLSAVNNDHLSQGFHLMHLGATVGEDWTPALHGWLRQRFSSSLYALTRTGGPQPPEGSLSSPYLDLPII